jgi:plastocyanin
MTAHRAMKRVAGPGVAGLAMLTAGCGSGAGTPHHAAVAARVPPGTVQVVMKNINFNPTRVRARVGQSVTWINRDDAPHNVTYVSGPRFASSVTFTEGGSWTLKLTKPGVIRYRCTIHPGMDGSIVVRR